MRASRFFIAAATLLACVGDKSVGTVTDERDGGGTGANDAATSSGRPGDASPTDGEPDAGPKDGGTSADGGLPSEKLVFVSSEPKSQSDLKDAYAVCTKELGAYGRGTGFAWAQDANGQSPRSKIAAVYGGPWVLPSGAVVFATRADITGGNGAAVAINETLSRSKLNGPAAWTALDKSGDAVAGQNCAGWTPAGGNSPGTHLGVTGPSWANDGTLLDCQTQNYIICFEE